ncbi:MAG TPA: hypothetical protein VIF60_21205 [Burkholderiaceae bacterium]
MQLPSLTLPFVNSRKVKRANRLSEFFLLPFRAAAFSVPLLLAGCGGGGGPAGPTPTIPPVGTGITGCPIVRLTPQNGVGNVFVNTQVSVTYKAAAANQCSGLAITDSSGNSVPLQPVYTNEWPSSGGGVIGAVTVSTVNRLLPAAQYTISFAGSKAGSFQTGPAAALRGNAVTYADLNANENNYPAAPIINALDIDKSIYNVVASYYNSTALVTVALVAAIGVDAPNLSNLNVHYSAHIKKLTYTSTRADGTPITLSGLLTYPENANGRPFDYSTAKLIMFQHGSLSITNTTPPSSASSGDLIFNLIAAGKGYITFEPDLIGLGDTASTQSQAYLIAQDTGTASADMLLAVQDFFAKNYDGVKLGNKLWLAGASQGGFSVFAALPYVSSTADVTDVYAAEGPYNIFQTLSSGIFAIGGTPRDAYAQYENLDFLPSHLFSIMNSYQAYEGLNYATSDVFQSNGNLSNSFVQNYTAGKSTDLVFHSGLNSMVGSSIRYNAPNANVVLFHYSKDSLVPAQNTVDMMAFLNNGTHKLASVSRGDCHESSAFVTAFLLADKNLEASHVVCGLFYLDRLVGDL